MAATATRCSGYHREGDAHPQHRPEHRDGHDHRRHRPLRRRQRDLYRHGQLRRRLVHREQPDKPRHRRCPGTDPLLGQIGPQGSLPGRCRPQADGETNPPDHPGSGGFGYNQAVHPASPTRRRRTGARIWLTRGSSWRRRETPSPAPANPAEQGRRRPGPPAGHALISLPALNGLRVPEATGADIEHLALERGHRTLGRQGGHHPARAANRPGDRPGRRRAHRRAGVPGRGRPPAGPARRRRIVRNTARRAGTGKAATPQTLRHAFITAALDAGVPLRDVQQAASHAGPRTTIRCDRARGSLDRHATYIVAAHVAGAAR